MASIINTGISALNAFKRQMDTTGHNIANVNTEGYSRQTVQLTTREPQVYPQGYVGTGVDVASIRRNYDDYLATQVRDYSALHEEFSTYQQRATQIDNVIADSATGIDSSLQQFFASVNDVADDPTSIPARSVMLSRAQQLSDRFQSLDGWLEQMRGRVNQDLERQVGDVNAIARSLAEVNTRILSVNGAAGAPPNDLLDERDRMIDELSHYTSVSTLAQSDGTVNVFVGSGQALVVGTSYNTLGVTDNPMSADQKELVIQQAGGQVVNVTQQMSGGSLGGLLRFRDEVLDETQNALGRVAIGLASLFNEQHRDGFDLDGQPGGDFFSLTAPQALGSSTNAAGSSVSISIDDPSLLTTHEYRLDFDGSNWSMTDLDSGGSIPLSASGAPLTLNASPPAELGFSVVVNAAAANDSFLLRPTRGGAAGLEVLVSDERDIAAAEAIGVGDNRNARRLADLQNAHLMMGGTATLSDTYRSLIADVGSKTQQAASNAATQGHLLAQAEASKAEVSGVNLDEEAANLVRFQQAYQAAAQVINVANSLFDSLLAAVRR